MNNNVLEVQELERARKIFWLVANDKIFFSAYNNSKKDCDDGAYPAINCNDVFVAAADAESLNINELDAFIEVVKKFPNYGEYAWVSYKRSGARPWRQPSSEEFKKEFEQALIEIPKIVESFNESKKI